MKAKQVRMKNLLLINHHLSYLKTRDRVELHHYRMSDDPEINKDAVFLEEFQKVLEKNETSVLFKPHLNKMKAIFFEARINLRKRITAKI